MSRPNKFRYYKINNTFTQISLRFLNDSFRLEYTSIGLGLTIIAQLKVISRTVQTS